MSRAGNPEPRPAKRSPRPSPARPLLRRDRRVALAADPLLQVRRGRLADDPARRHASVHRQPQIEPRGHCAPHHVEDTFCRIKRPRRIILRPQFHWTDPKIEAYVFCCALALLLTSLSRRDLRRRGLQRSLRTLAGDPRRLRIQPTCLRRPSPPRPHTARTHRRVRSHPGRIPFPRNARERDMGFRRLVPLANSLEPHTNGGPQRKPFQFTPREFPHGRPLESCPQAAHRELPLGHRVS